MTKYLLEIKKIKKVFNHKNGLIKVFDNVNDVEVTELVNKFDNSVSTVAKEMNINQSDLVDYFERETNNQLGV